MAREFSFEIREKDIAGRIGKLNINGKVLETPALMPVYSPSKPLITPSELEREFKSEILMTNSYILLRNDEFRRDVEEKGIHRFLNFNCLIATDSGSYQLMNYGSVFTTNREIIEFQEKIGTDIGSFLDIPSLPDAYKPRVEEQLKITLDRAKEALNAGFIVNAGIQGSTYLDLRERAAEEIGKNFNLCAIGGIVRLVEDYRFNKLVEIIATVKMNIPSDRVVHAFGLGHPMVFSLAIALGCDLFDSAAYALYAQNFRYLTENGTRKLDDLEYMPCSCPVCSKYGTELKELDRDEKIRELARHNLYVSFEELRRIKQAIKENCLWEFICERARSHPELLSGLETLMNYTEYLAKFDPITKRKPFYYTGFESEKRTEVINAKNRLKRLSSQKRIDIFPFGEIPAEVSDIYPFGTIMLPESLKREKIRYKIRDIEKIRKIMDYQFGPDAGRLINNVRIKRSRKTHRIRWIYQDRELIASIRASDHFIIPKTPLAEKLKRKFRFPKLRVVIHEDAVPFVKEGKSVFAKFVKGIDPELRAGDEVLIVDEDDNLIRTGTLLLSPQECIDFERGVAVRVR